MSYLIDSDWVIDWLMGRPAAVALVGRLMADDAAISIMTSAEVYEGICYGRDAHLTAAAFRRFLRAVPVLPVTRAVARRYARIRGDLRRQGLLIPQPDMLIAATALTYDRMLVTRNVRDFQRIPGLRLYP